MFGYPRSSYLFSFGQTLQTIRDTYTECNYVADPHTAVGIAAAKIVRDNHYDEAPLQWFVSPMLLYLASLTCNLLSNSSPDMVQLILSTAHPAKFSEAVTQALGNISGFSFEKDVLPEEFKDLLNKERRVIDVENSPEAVKKVIDDREPGDKAKEVEVGV